MIEAMKKMTHRQWAGFLGSILAAVLTAASAYFFIAFTISWFGASLADHPNATRHGWCWLLSLLGMMSGFLGHHHVFRRLWIDAGL